MFSSALPYTGNYLRNHLFYNISVNISVLLWLLICDIPYESYVILQAINKTDRNIEMDTLLKRTSSIDTCTNHKKIIFWFVFRFKLVLNHYSNM